MQSTQSIIAVWPDSTWCYLDDSPDYLWKSDDFILVLFDYLDSNSADQAAIRALPYL